MERTIKKIAYGLFYLIIFSGIVFAVYKSKFEPVETCFDGAQNQTEEGVDCGGTCIACRILQLKNPEIKGEVKIFSVSSGKTILLAETINPNADYGISQFNYYFKIYGEGDILLETLNGEDSLFPGEKKYLYSAETKSERGKIQKVVLEFERAKWRTAYDYVKPESPVVQNLATEVSAGLMKVNGMIRNVGPLEIKKLNLIAVLYDKFGIEIFAAQTFISDLPGFSEKSFEVNFPKDQELAEKTDKGKTKVFINY